MINIPKKQAKCKKKLPFLDDNILQLQQQQKLLQFLLLHRSTKSNEDSVWRCFAATVWVWNDWHPSPSAAAERSFDQCANKLGLFIFRSKGALFCHFHSAQAHLMLFALRFLLASLASPLFRRLEFYFNFLAPSNWMLELKQQQLPHETWSIRWS